MREKNSDKNKFPIFIMGKEYKKLHELFFAAFFGPRRSLLQFEHGRRAVAERSVCGVNAPVEFFL